MSVSVRFTCNEGSKTGVPCPAYVAVALDLAPFADDLMVAEDGLWLLETEWHTPPEGWQLQRDGTALCPDHAVTS